MHSFKSAKQFSMAFVIFLSVLFRLSKIYETRDIAIRRYNNFINIDNSTLFFNCISSNSIHFMCNLIFDPGNLDKWTNVKTELYSSSESSFNWMRLDYLISSPTTFDGNKLKVQIITQI